MGDVLRAALVDASSPEATDEDPPGGSFLRLARRVGMQDPEVSIAALQNQSLGPEGPQGRARRPDLHEGDCDGLWSVNNAKFFLRCRKTGSLQVCLPDFEIPSKLMNCINN